MLSWFHTTMHWFRHAGIAEVIFVLLQATTGESLWPGVTRDDDAPYQ
tara:strand:+ start:1146 stop:1286 length:141 start_codon:yes stop_codon:yes gene_type:complete